MQNSSENGAESTSGALHCYTERHVDDCAAAYENGSGLPFIVLLFALVNGKLECACGKVIRADHFGNIIKHLVKVCHLMSQPDDSVKRSKRESMIRKLPELVLWWLVSKMYINLEHCTFHQPTQDQRKKTTLSWNRKQQVFMRRFFETMDSQAEAMLAIEAPPQNEETGEDPKEAGLAILQNELAVSVPEIVEVEVEEKPEPELIDLCSDEEDGVDDKDDEEKPTLHQLFNYSLDDRFARMQKQLDDLAARVAAGEQKYHPKPKKEAKQSAGGRRGTSNAVGFNSSQRRFYQVEPSTGPSNGMVLRSQVNRR